MHKLKIETKEENVKKSFENCIRFYYEGLTLKVLVVQSKAQKRQYNSLPQTIYKHNSTFPMPLVVTINIPTLETLSYIDYIVLQ